MTTARKITVTVEVPRASDPGGKGRRITWILLPGSFDDADGDADTAVGPPAEGTNPGADFGSERDDG